MMAFSLQSDQAQQNHSSLIKKPQEEQKYSTDIIKKTHAHTQKHKQTQ